EGTCKGLEPYVEVFQGPFTTDGVPEEDRKKIDHLVAPKTPPCKTHTLTDLGQDTVLAKVPDEQRSFPKPGRGRGNGRSRSLDDYRSIGDTDHMCLLERMECVLPSQKGTFLSLLAMG